MHMLQRLITLVAVGTLSAAPLALSSAWADPPKSDDVDTTVTFTSGGPGAPACGSQPSESELTVAVEGTLRVANGMNTGAQLTIDGSPLAAVAGSESVELQFHRGPVAVAMVPDCGTATDAQPLTVDVSERPVPGQRNVPARPQKPRHTPVPAQGKGTKGAPVTRPSSGSGGVVADSTPSPASSLDTPAVTIIKPNAAAEARDNRPVDKGPIGLLAIIATVCVAGVLAGVIRATITQRESRPELS
jgi:hypothetical protein